MTVFVNLLLFMLLSSVISLLVSIPPGNLLTSLLGLLVTSALIAPLLFIFLQVLFEDLQAANKDLKIAESGFTHHKILAGAGFVSMVLLSTAILASL